MYIIFKDTNATQKVVQKIVQLDPMTNVNRAWATVLVKTTKDVVAAVQFPERRVKIWKAGEPNNHIYIDFSNLVSVQDL